MEAELSVSSWVRSYNGNKPQQASSLPSSACYAHPLYTFFCDMIYERRRSFPQRAYSIQINRNMQPIIIIGWVRSPCDHQSSGHRHRITRIWIVHTSNLSSVFLMQQLNLHSGEVYYISYDFLSRPYRTPNTPQRKKWSLWVDHNYSGHETLCARRVFFSLRLSFFCRRWHLIFALKIRNLCDWACVRKTGPGRLRCPFCVRPPNIVTTCEHKTQIQNPQSAMQWKRWRWHP